MMSILPPAVFSYGVISPFYIFFGIENSVMTSFVLLMICGIYSYCLYFDGVKFPLLFFFLLSGYVNGG